MPQHPIGLSISRAQHKMTEKRKTSQGYTIRTPQHLATKPRNTTNPATLPQAATKLPSRSKSSLQCKWSIGIIHNLYINIFKNGQLDQGLKGNDNDMQVTFNMCVSLIKICVFYNNNKTPAQAFTLT
jgi:hypothetical protein